MTIGLAPALVTGEVPEGWAAIRLPVCCAGAALEPALLTDLLGVGRARVPDIRRYAPDERALR